MKVTKVIYGETFNTGNYESIRLGVEIETTSSPAVGFAEARKTVRDEYRSMQDGGVKFKR